MGDKTHFGYQQVDEAEKAQKVADEQQAADAERMLSFPTPKYTESAPACMAAASAS